jgi:hypothetical protein
MQTSHAFVRMRLAEEGPPAHPSAAPSVWGPHTNAWRGALLLCVSGVGRGQGLGVEELLAPLDAVRKVHEAMDAKEFNNDVTYKGGMAQVRRRQRGGWMGLGLGPTSPYGYKW